MERWNNLAMEERIVLLDLESMMDEKFNPHTAPSGYELARRTGIDPGILPIVLRLLDGRGLIEYHEYSGGRMATVAGLLLVRVARQHGVAHPHGAIS